MLFCWSNDPSLISVAIVCYHIVMKINIWKFSIIFWRPLWIFAKFLVFQCKFVGRFFFGYSEGSRKVKFNDEISTFVNNLNVSNTTRVTKIIYNVTHAITYSYYIRYLQYASMFSQIKAVLTVFNSSDICNHSVRHEK